MDYDGHPMSKRVTFEEPLFIDIVEEYDEKSDADFKRPRPRFRKFLLWCLAAVSLIFLLSGSHGENIKAWRSQWISADRRFSPPLWHSRSEAC